MVLNDLSGRDTIYDCLKMCLIVERGNAMKTSRKISIFIIVLSLAMGARIAAAQANRPDNQAQPPQPDRIVTQTGLQQEVRQLATDLDDPNYDYSKAPDRIRQAFQDMRTVTNNMDPDEARQFRMDLMQQVLPVFQRNQAKIQKAMQMAFLKDLQQPLGASDDEFAVIRPLLEKVVDAQNEAGGGAGRFRRFGGFGGAPGQQNNNTQNAAPNAPALSPVDQATQDLQAAVDDPNINSDVIKTRLDTLRQVKSKASQDLTVARDALRAVLTVRQEAVLVDRGVLD